MGKLRENRSAKLAAQNGFATDLKSRSLKPSEQHKIVIKVQYLKGNLHGNKSPMLQLHKMALQQT